MNMKRIIYTLFLAVSCLYGYADVTDYVDPKIGSEGLGRVVVGPSCPFGMVKPSPDCTADNNSGWAPMPVQVDGFSQTHVSGTGGGPKYGNVLIQPFCGEMNRVSCPDYRTSETISLGYYATTYKNSGITTEVTTAERACLYRVSYPKDSVPNLLIDGGWYLGRKDEPDARECQQFVGSEIQILSDYEVSGYTRVRGGWNKGHVYTVYFYIKADKPMTDYRTWRVPAKMFDKSPKLVIEKKTAQVDIEQETGALLHFNKQENGEPIMFKVGISYISELRAKANAEQYVPTWDFEASKNSCIAEWRQLLDKIDIDPSSTDSQKRMFYTGLYHTMLMPVDRTGENPLWYEPGEPYYDDFYAIWDTYRSSSPLITFITPKKQVEIIRALVNIGKRDGFMPDSRSGNANGRTQGGSNAEIVIADALIKDLGTTNTAKELGTDVIDWEEALKQMLKDATVPPGGTEEQEGRGGLREYLELGYVPYGIDRSGNRTMEYSFCDYAIAQVAKKLGRTALYEQYMKQSSNWKNLWRSDYEHAGTKGFILPRDRNGNWLDTLVVGHSKNLKPTFIYTPVTRESPWYTAWWGTVFYEATSWEYSLSVPQDVPGLIEQCGGKEAFEKRLDTFFDKGFYNVNNEPSFLTPCLYHWIGRPDRTSDRVRAIIAKSFGDSPLGLPGNDDSGAMSSWLAFHMMGFYPNAGTDYYVIHTPILKSATLHLANGKDFTIKAPKLSDKNLYIKAVKLNGVDYPYSTINHKQIMEGGTLELIMDKKPGDWGKEMNIAEP